MKRAIPFTLVVLVLSALPGLAPAKERGCANRLAVVAETERVLVEALRSGQKVDEARSNFVRAREKAYEEGCLAGTQWDRGTQYDRDPRYRDPFADNDSRDYYNENRNDNRGNGYGRERQLRQRMDDLVALGYRRGLSRDEFRELEDLRQRFGR